MCTICLDAVIGPALRTAERRLGRYTPCGCEKLCWDCAYNHAMRSSLWGADNQPILNEDDLNSKIVRCPCCNSTVDAFEECTPTGTTLTVCALPFRDLSAQERCTLRSEPPSAWGRERAEPQHERSPGERAEARAAERGARRSAEQQAKHSTLVEEAEFREGVAQLVDSSGLRAALARPMQVWNMVRARAIPMPMPVPVHMPMPMPMPMPVPMPMPTFAGVGSCAPRSCWLQGGGAAAPPSKPRGAGPRPEACVQPGNPTC